ncbi:MAG TPA: adenosylcobinamide-GDP ribazoletransferase [Noviherbaspirillum sp.]
MHPFNPSRTGILGRGVHQVRLFFVALQFFTRLPVPRWVDFEAEWLHHASRYFPAVGIVVGAAASAVYVLAGWFWPQPVAVLLSTITGIWLTGAFHEDGLADACDGLGGGMTKERVLDIMKDSRIGSYGAIGIGLLLALKCTVLSCLPAHMAAAAMLAAHPVSRLAATALIWKLDYVKSEGKAKPLAQHMSGAEFAIALTTVLVVLAALYLFDALPWQSIATGVAAAALVTVWLARKFVKRIGGYTGDCLGAVQQSAEVAMYLALLAVVK